MIDGVREVGTLNPKAWFPDCQGVIWRAAYGYIQIRSEGYEVWSHDGEDTGEIVCYFPKDGVESVTFGMHAGEVGPNILDCTV